MIEVITNIILFDGIKGMTEVITDSIREVIPTIASMISIKVLKSKLLWMNQLTLSIRTS